MFENGEEENTSPFFKKSGGALFSPDQHKTIPEEAVLQPPQGSGL